MNEYLQNKDNQKIFFVGDIGLNEENPWPSSSQVAMQNGSMPAKENFYKGG